MLFKFCFLLTTLMSLASCGKGLDTDSNTENETVNNRGGAGGTFKRISLVARSMPTGDDFSQFDNACSAGYKALVASSTRHPDVGSGATNWILAANTEYRRMDGVTVIGTTNANAVFTFPLSNSFGTVAGKFYTGFYNNWSFDNASTCFDWSLMIDDRNYGDALSTSSNAINDGLWNCGTSGPAATDFFVACVEQ